MPKPAPAFLTILFIATAANASDCMKAGIDDQIVEGKLNVEHRTDEFGVIKYRPYILTLENPTCLDTEYAEYHVISATKIHLIPYKNVEKKSTFVNWEKCACSR